MSVSFDFDRVPEDTGKIQEPSIVPSEQPNKQEQAHLAAKMQNTVLVETFFTDKKLVKMFVDAISPDEVRDKLRTTIFTTGLSLSFVLTALANLSFWAGFYSLIPFFFIYLVYIIFLRRLVETSYVKGKLQKFKDFFETKDNLNSFLDTLINNKHIGSGLYSDYKIKISSSDWDSQLRALFYRAPTDEIRELIKKSNGDISEEVLHWNLKHFLHRYYMSGDDKDLLFFLNQVAPLIRQRLTADQLSVSLSNKKELFHLITDKIGK